MKRENLWMTVIGAALVMVAMTAGRAAMQSPTMLYLAGQLQVAAGHTDEGIRLINQAASQHESGTVHAAQPAAQPSEVCTKSRPKTSQLKPAASAKPVTVAANLPPAAKKPQPLALLARLQVPMPPIPPAAFESKQLADYLNDQQRAEIIKAKVEVQRSQAERLKHIRHQTEVVIERYAPTAMSFNPVDFTTLERDLPSAVGQMAH